MVKSFRVPNTENPFICTLIRTDELFEYRRFVAWEHCQIGFDSYVFKEGQDPTLIYNFAAEANAARYERMLAAKTGPPRTLHPWVVMLLEEETRFRQAIFCIMMGIFYPAVSGEAYVWCIDLPDPSGDNREIILSPPGKMEEILFQALYNFVIRGHDIRPGYEHVSIFPDLPDQPNLVALTICKQQEAWGAQQEADEWKRKLDPNNVNTFLSRLKGWVHDSQGQLAHEEFDDLATLIEIILQERIIELGKDELPNASPLVSPATPKVTFD